MSRLALALLLLSACSSYEDAATKIAFDPAGGFWDLPFPSELRKQTDGTYGYKNYPKRTGERATTNTLAEMWLNSADAHLEDGFGVSSAVYFTATGAIDPATLPATPAASASFDSTAFLVDVDPASPERGRVFPMRVQAREADELAPPNQIGLIPVFGVVRRSATQYAAVLTTGIKDAAGAPIGRSRTFHDLFSGDSYAPLRELLEEKGVALDTVAAATLFKTVDVNAIPRRIAAWTEKLPAPALTGAWKVAQDYESYQVLTSTYTVPVIQAGERPYTSRPSGRIVFDANGDPIAQGTQQVRLVVTIPKRAQPASGFPMVMYLHGSGGEWYEGIDRGPKPPTGPIRSLPDPPLGSGPAEWLARRGIAMAGFDFPIHGNRNDPPDTTGLVFYNLFGNIDATIDNFYVSTMELLILSRLLNQVTIDASIAATLNGGGAPMIHFDPARLAAMGHSMGSTLGVAWAAWDPRIKAFFVSGGGGILAEIGVSATHPNDLRAFVEGILEIGAERHLDDGHPILHMFQNLWDLADPIARARHVVREPYEGVPPKHVFMTVGVRDGYFAPKAQNAMAAALGLQLAGPSADPELPETLGLAGLEPLPLPARGNVNGKTAVATHYAVPFDLGHYVAFDREDARFQYTCFLATVAAPAGAVVGAPAALDAACPE